MIYIFLHMSIRCINFWFITRWKLSIFGKNAKINIWNLNLQLKNIKIFKINFSIYTHIFLNNFLIYKIQKSKFLINVKWNEFYDSIIKNTKQLYSFLKKVQLNFIILKITYLLYIKILWLRMFIKSRLQIIYKYKYDHLLQMMWILFKNI